MRRTMSETQEHPGSMPVIVSYTKYWVDFITCVHLPKALSGELLREEQSYVEDYMSPTRAD